MPDTQTTVISDTPDNFIELINYSLDPNMWIVRRSKKKFLFFKKRLSSDWFNKKDDAEKYAEKLKNENSNDSR